jgi:hypothetical protein
MKLRVAALGMLVATGSTVAWGQTAEEQESMKGRTAELSAKAAEVNKECGSKLTVSLDWKTFVPHFHDAVEGDMMNSCNKPSTAQQSTACAVDPCEIVLNGISQVCSSTYGEIGKASVAAGITSVRCVFDASVPPHPAVTIPLALKSGVLTARYNLRAKDTQSTMMWLIDNLPASPPLAGAPRPLTVMEKLKVDERNSELKAKIDEAASACGTRIEAVVDWPTFIPHFHDTLKDAAGREDTIDPCNNPSAAQAATCAQNPCAIVVDSLRSACAQGAAGKAAVTRSVKSVLCRFDATVPSHPAETIPLGLAPSGVLTARYNWRAKNTGSTDRWLRAHLPKK